MNTKGAVICFQKYILGNVKEDGYKTPGGPICFGFMGRVDIRPVATFRDFMAIASQHGTEYACTRKQLFIYQIDKKFDQAVELVDLGGTLSGNGSGNPNDGRLPFCCSGSGKRTGLCCCSVLNISQELAGADVKEAADWLYSVLERRKESLHKRGEEIEFALTGLLGAEDICLILLSDHFSAISSTISAIQGTTRLAAGNIEIPIVDNSHSILLLDCSEEGRHCDWGDSKAEIFFSAKSAAGYAYLQRACQELQELCMASGGTAAEAAIAGCYGGYDTAIRFPAHLLNPGLYCGKDGLFSYDNPKYQEAVYQSETVVYPFGYNGSDFLSIKGHRNGPPGSADSDGLDVEIERAIKQITLNILNTDEDKYQELTYVRLALYRLLKDYRRITSSLFNAVLYQDLLVQFRTVISAIVSASTPCRDGNTNETVPEFNKIFEEIIDALNSAMWTFDQIDRLSFGEQSSYIQNIGSYYKILRCYYGIIKDILCLFYSVERDAGSRQPMLIPLLSFGLTPIIHSRCYSAEYALDGGGEALPARLICIKLPYQALANPPKYLGILVHEIFHYLAPPRTDEWNQSFSLCLFRVAVSGLVGVFAQQMPNSESAKNYAGEFERQYWDIIDPAARCIAIEVFERNPELGKLEAEELKNRLFRLLDFKRNPDSGSYKFYRSIWRNLRLQFSAPHDDKVLAYVFALDDTVGDKDDEETVFALFADRVRSVPDFRPLRELLTSFYEALSEVTADLFDVGSVLYGESHEQWARQYFWQIYGTRCDMLLGIEESEAGIPQTKYAMLYANSIRIGIFMDYCLCIDRDTENREERYARKLKEWCSGKADSDRFLQAQVTFRRDYWLYTECSNLYTRHEREYCDLVLSARESMKKKCAGIMKKLSGFYKRYYQAQEARQIGALQETDMNCAHFDLCTDILEYWQKQQPLRDLCEEALRTPTAPAERTYSCIAPLRKILGGDSHTPCVYAEYPEELSRKITLAYEKMAVHGEIPVLWYRGQRNKHKDTLPNIMRSHANGDSSFLPEFRQEVHLARTQILPKGAELSKAEWLAFLQHNEFKTNLLDFSEEFYPALYFAIQKWMDAPNELPECDSHITMFNPILFNLAMRALDKPDKRSNEKNALFEYLSYGTVEKGAFLKLPLFTCDDVNEDDYCHYFSWNREFVFKKSCRPIAAMIPKNSDRMKRQSGQFVFFDLRCRAELENGKYSYSAHSLESLHKEYLDFIHSEGFQTPFLYNININHFEYKAFVAYARAIGLRKYHVYPELDKLAKDLDLLFRK